VSGAAICSYGLWHLGCVTAACLAAEGHTVVGLDPDAKRVRALQAGQPPVAEPGLAELIASGLQSGNLSFTNDRAASAQARLLWVTFDTPVDEDDRADTVWVRAQLETLRSVVRANTLVLVSSQVPVGFTGALERDWRTTDPTLRFACSPENLRLGRAIEVFRHPERVVIGLGASTPRQSLAELFSPFSEHIEWMSLASAEMSKHALNGFLALSASYANELARIGERVGADSAEVERALRSDPRVGARAYVAAGPPLAGGTLVRDVEFLRSLARAHGLASPVADGIAESNRLHQLWTQQRLSEFLDTADARRVALLGLTYKAGTDTLRRSSSVELAHWLLEQDVEVRAYDPAVTSLPPGLSEVTLASGMVEALEACDVAVLATAWPEFAALTADQVVGSMRWPRVIDQTGMLAHLGGDRRVTYVRVGRPPGLGDSA
jgi:UDPglucose 6-dehydrogenase